MHWVIAGSSGYLGRSLRAALASRARSGERDLRVTRLLRRTSRATRSGSLGSSGSSGLPGPPGLDERIAIWDPASGPEDPSVLADADVVVHLAGASLTRLPWTEAYKQTIRESRVETTRALGAAIAALGRDDPPVFVVQSATGYYGKDVAGSAVDESSPAGHDFLASVVRDWEAAAVEAERAGVRVVRLRTGLVVSRDAPAFRLLSLPFRLGLGGRLGTGRQVMCPVARADWTAAVRFVAEHPGCRGAYNVVQPEAPTNAEFTRALGAALRRPTAIPVPGFAIRALVGDFAGELLGSARILPRRLTEAGFTFRMPDVDSLVRYATAP